jgi:2-polyprenyl-3-methyl-5-hydroxy-6-metoxy-1,4-benzoquinol methylase
MNSNTIQLNGRRLRILVAIASHGEKNLGFLKKIISTYQAFNAEVSVVVLSNIPKELGTGVKVVVGLPAKNPWTLPFAHKRVFAESVEDHDLFVFTEDDIGVTEGNIRAFLRVTPQLAEDEIAGYLRYEVDLSGKWSLPEVHGASHWRPETVKRRGDHTVAEFTNEHAGFYILTQAQLRRAIASGGFLNAPYEGEYGLPETAATDPYTRCGFRKVICISALGDFLIHHMPNRYVGKLGVPLETFQEQIRTLVSIENGTHPATTLCEAESRFLHRRWSKELYEKPDDEVLNGSPVRGKSILSVGCGWGATEAGLAERGAAVTALPLDSVLGAGLGRPGVEVVYGTLAECLDKLEGRKFDYVLMKDLLHLLPDPQPVLARCSRLLEAGGFFVLSGPNFSRIKVSIKRVLRAGHYGKLSRFAESGINVCGPRSVAKWLESAGLSVAPVQWTTPGKDSDGSTHHHGRFGRLFAEAWQLQARR